MNLHRACGHARCEQVVLDLLVHHDEPDADESLDRRVEEREQNRQHAGEICADDGQELRHEADPQRHRNGCRDADGLEGNPVEESRERREQCA